jgi:acyl-protein synthetase LuxE
MTIMERLESRIEGFLRTGEGDFDALALELFSYQFEKNLPYQAYCRAQDIAPPKVRRWQEIPAVPIAAFKSADLATFPLGQAAAQFQSSGTTRQIPSRHFLKTLTYYETSLKWGFAKWVLRAGSDPNEKRGVPLGQTPFFILAPSPAEAPRSSLSWMLDVVRRTFGSAGSVFLVQHGRLDERRLATLLAKAEATREPVALLGTTIAFLGFFDYAGQTGKRYRLPPASRLMDTGGLKTSERAISRPEFVRLAEDILGIPENDCVNEYGMCELGSQFYGRGPSSFLEGPPWTRTLVIDPDTGDVAPSGKPGLLRHFDLANVDSVLAIQTEDVGRGRGGAAGEGSAFILLGRDPNAEVKGCALSAEAFLS